MIRILLVDIHPTLSRSVKRLLARDPDFKVLADLPTSAAAMRDYSAEQPDVVVLGMHPKRLDEVRTLAAGFPAARLVVFGPGDGPHYANVSRALGASAFVSSLTAERDLPAAIRSNSLVA